MEIRLIPCVDGQCSISWAVANALRPQVHLAHPAGRLCILFALIHAEHPDAVVGRLDGISGNERQYDVCRGGVAIGIAVAAQLGGLAFFDELFQPANATNACLPLRENGLLAVNDGVETTIQYPSMVSFLRCHQNGTLPATNNSTGVRPCSTSSGRGSEAAKISDAGHWLG